LTIASYASVSVEGSALDTGIDGGLTLIPVNEKNIYDAMRNKRVTLYIYL
jgi:hypothetical protein